MSAEVIRDPDGCLWVIEGGRGAWRVRGVGAPVKRYNSKKAARADIAAGLMAICGEIRPGRDPKRPDHICRCDGRKAACRDFRWHHCIDCGATWEAAS
jgi:hypothetical protein